MIFTTHHITDTTKRYFNVLWGINKKKDYENTFQKTTQHELLR
jgi:hypothetical protein